LALVVANYQEANGRYPPPFVNGPDGRPWHSWRILILPYIEQSDLYKEYRLDEPWDGPNNRKLTERMPRLYAFHGSARPGNTTANYLAVVGEETVWNGAKPVASADVADSPSTTILLVENNGADVHWMEPRVLSLAELDLRVNSPGGISSPYESPAVVMLDGSVHRLRAELRPATLRALFTIRGGEHLTNDDAAGWDVIEDGRQRSRREH
jgi:hypothetical protein